MIKSFPTGFCPPNPPTGTTTTTTITGSTTAANPSTTTPIDGMSLTITLRDAVNNAVIEGAQVQIKEQGMSGKFILLKTNL